jgi:hypothetical protein
MKLLFVLLVCMSFLLCNIRTQAQQGKYDTLIRTAVIYNGDTISTKEIREVFIYATAPLWLVKQRREYRKNKEQYDRLRYNVGIVYPYAVKASVILKDVDSVMNSLNSKEAKKQYARNKEIELNREFKDQLTDLTITQGQLLVKLISRQTGRNCYDIIRDLKGGMNAGIFQIMAKLFDNNLKNHYDAIGEDATIEAIVKELEVNR